MEDKNKKLLIKMMRGQCQMWDCMMEMMKNYPDDIAATCIKDFNDRWRVDILFCNEVVMNLSKTWDSYEEAATYANEYVDKLKGKK